MVIFIEKNNPTLYCWYNMMLLSLGLGMKKAFMTHGGFRSASRPLAVLLAVLFSSGWLVAAKNAGRVDVETLAIFPPWEDRLSVYQSIAATGVSILGPGPFFWTMVIVAQSDQTAEQLANARGFVVLNAAAARLCGFGART